MDAMDAMDATDAIEPGRAPAFASAGASAKQLTPTFSVKVHATRELPTTLAIELLAEAVREDGAAPTATDFAARAPPSTILAILDNSGSMHRHMSTLHACAGALVAAAPPNSTLGFLTFDDEARVAVAPRPVHPSMASEVIPHLTCKGRHTNISDALTLALDVAATAATPTVTLILLTDGEATHGLIHAQAILEHARAHTAFADVALHCIGFGDAGACVGASLLCALSLASGGAFHRVGRPEDVGAAFGDSIASTLMRLATIHVSIQGDGGEEELLSPPRGIQLQHQEQQVLVKNLAAPTASVTIRLKEGGTGRLLHVATIQLAEAAEGDSPTVAAAHLFRVRCLEALKRLDAAQEALRTVEADRPQFSLEALDRVAGIPRILGAPMVPHQPTLLRSNSTAYVVPMISGGLAPPNERGDALSFGLGTRAATISSTLYPHSLTTTTTTTLALAPTESQDALATFRLAERIHLARMDAAQRTRDACKAQLQLLAEQALAGAHPLHHELRGRLAAVLEQLELPAADNAIATLLHEVQTQRSGVLALPLPLPALGPPPLSHGLSHVSMAAQTMRTTSGAFVLRATSHTPT